MKTITVRKPRSHRAAIRTFAVLEVLVPFLMAVCFRQSLYLMILLCSPALVIGMGLLLYCETWSIRFDSRGITRSVFGASGKVHGQGDIVDVLTRWSSADRAQILRITFSDGRSVKFRLTDENGEKARKWILSRHTIRMLE